MATLSHDSVRAFAQAIQVELSEAEHSSGHSLLHLSYEFKSLSNGIKYCSVQIECEAGCGWLVEGTGDEAEVLREKAIIMQRMLQDSAGQAPNSVSESLLTVFPDVVIKNHRA